jgi:hypothetical protein
MSISTYAELKTAIGNWLAKDNLSSVIPDFITLAESRINRQLRTLEMQTAVNLTVSTQRVSAPSDELEAIRIYIDGDPKKVVQYVSPEYFFSRYAASMTGQPDMFTREGGQYVFGPSPDTTYTGKLLYVQKVPALGDSNATNWLLTANPDVYLYGALIEAKAYLMDDARIPIWAQAFDSAINDLNDQSKQKAVSGSELQVRAI